MIKTGDDIHYLSPNVNGLGNTPLNLSAGIALRSLKAEREHDYY